MEDSGLPPSICVPNPDAQWSMPDFEYLSESDEVVIENATFLKMNQVHVAAAPKRAPLLYAGPETFRRCCDTFCPGLSEPRLIAGYLTFGKLECKFSSDGMQV